MAFGNKLRNRIVGVLVIVSIILILLPVMMQDRPVPNEPINEKPIAVNEEAVITTQSDNAGLWALDTLAGKYGWKITVPHAEMNRLVSKMFIKNTIV